MAISAESGRWQATRLRYGAAPSPGAQRNAAADAKLIVIGEESRREAETKNSTSGIGAPFVTSFHPNRQTAALAFAP